LSEIYKIINKIYGKTYVGQTRNSLEERLYSHLKSTRYGSKLPIHCTIRKYGKENFLIETIEKRDNFELNEKEKYWIKKLNTLCPEGYNIRNGGRGKQPEDLKLKIRESLKHKRNVTLQFNPKTGEIINEFDSRIKAGKKLNIRCYQIVLCTKNYLKKTTKGFGFIYKSDYEKLMDKSKLIIKGFGKFGNRSKCVYGIDDNGNKIEFDFIKDAAKFLNCTHNAIINSIKRGKNCKGYKWNYQQNEVNNGG